MNMNLAAQTEPMPSGCKSAWLAAWYCGELIQDDITPRVGLYGMDGGERDFRQGFPIGR